MSAICPHCNKRDPECPFRSPEAFTSLLCAYIVDFMSIEEIDRLDDGFFEKWERQAIEPIKEVFQERDRLKSQVEELQRELREARALFGQINDIAETGSLRGAAYAFGQIQRICSDAVKARGWR